MSRDLWDTLQSALRQTHASTPALQAFCAFPHDLAPQDVNPFHIPASDLLTAERGLTTDRHAEMRDVLVAAAPLAHWRETYKGTDIGQDSLDPFGCYCLIGTGGPFDSAHAWAWVVYMPPHLHYPWHHHPGEEMYLVLAGEAAFHRAGEPSETLRAGDTSYHASNQSHAMTTHDHPVMALVMWRNGFSKPPVLS